MSQRSPLRERVNRRQRTKLPSGRSLVRGKLLGGTMATLALRPIRATEAGEAQSVAP